MQKCASVILVLQLALASRSACCGAAEPEPDSKRVVKESLVGAWQGTLKVQVVELRVVLHISSDGDGLKATLDSPDQGAKGIPVDRVALEGDTLTLELKKIKASFEGKVLEGDDGQ